MHVALLKSKARHAGGLEKHAARIALAFAERGAKVTLLTTGVPPPSPHSAIAFRSFPTLPWPPFLKMDQFDRQVQSWVKREAPDLVLGMDRNRSQTHFRAGNGVHIAYLKSRIAPEGKIKYWACRCNPMHQKILQIEKEAFESPHLRKLFANSAMVRAQLLEHYAIDPAKIEVIHNGVEWDEMQADFATWEEKKKEACLARDLDPDQFHFLFIGNGYLRKGLLPLLRALSQLRDRSFSLSIVGNEKQIPFYQQEAQRLGLTEHARFFGPQANILPFYQLADALVIPSFYDPFANVTVEALAMGLFVVSSQHNGGSEVLTAKTGEIIENLLDPDSLLASLQTAMRHPKTPTSAREIRKSIRALDFSHQLGKLIEGCCE